MAAQQGNPLMCAEEGVAEAALLSAPQTGTRKVSKRQRTLMKTAGIVCCCALFAAAAAFAVLKQQQQPSDTAPMSNSETANPFLQAGTDLISLRLAHERLLPCQRRFNGSLCNSATVLDRATIVSKEGLSELSVGPWTPFNSDVTGGAFALTDGDTALQVQRAGLYHVTAQLVAQLLDQSAVRTVECAVRVNNRVDIAGRSLSASRPLTCLAVGLLRLQPGDQIRVTLLSLDNDSMRDRFRIQASRPGLTFLQAARIGL